MRSGFAAAQGAGAGREATLINAAPPPRALGARRVHLRELGQGRARLERARPGACRGRRRPAREPPSEGMCRRPDLDQRGAASSRAATGRKLPPSVTFARPSAAPSRPSSRPARISPRSRSGIATAKSSSLPGTRGSPLPHGGGRDGAVLRARFDTVAPTRRPVAGALRSQLTGASPVLRICCSRDARRAERRRVQWRSRVSRKALVGAVERSAVVRPSRQSGETSGAARRKRRYCMNSKS
jgi:hypothetical protein